MAGIWEAPDDIKKLVERVKEEHHTHLARAGVWVLCSDTKAVRNNQLVFTQSKKCTKTEKLSTGHDFKLVVMAELWGELTDAQRLAAVDEALCRCGVKYVPQTVEVNGRKEVVKDEWGRVVYTEEIDYDGENRPKWKINPPDAGVYYAMLMRHGKYNEEAENVARVLAGKAAKKPVAAERADVA